MEQKIVQLADNNHVFGQGINPDPPTRVAKTVPVSESMSAGVAVAPQIPEIISDVPSVVEMAKWPHLEDEDGHAYPIRPGVNTVGREDTDIVISDRSVSRRHSVIVYDEARELFSVEDAGSTNGSRVNGDLLPSHKPRALREGDSIIVGNIVLRFATHGVGPDKSYAPLVESSDDPTLPTNVNGSVGQEEVLARLELIRGDGPHEIFLNKGITTFGRSPDNNICLSDDKHVSSHHARLDAEGDLFLLIDIGSTNGTYLNGLRLTTNVAVAISDGDEIRIGSSLMAFRKSQLQDHSMRGAVDPTLITMPPIEGE